MKSNNGKPKFGGYIRVSTDEQAERGHSIKDQEARLKEEAKRKGWQLVVYKDEGISGKNEKRPAYQNLLEDLEQGKVEGVAVVRLDRLWRSFPGAVKAINLICYQWDRSLISLNEQFDTTTPAGKVMLNMLLAFGQYEREITAARTNESGRQRARRGLWSGNPPFGYRIFHPTEKDTSETNPDKKKRKRLVEKGKLFVDKDQAKTVREIFKLFLEKRTVRGVTLALNDREIKTQRGEAWALQSIKRVLTNPIYVGDLVYNQRNTSGDKAKHRPAEEHITREDVLPRILEDETFHTVQEILKSRVLKTRAQSTSYLLSGLLRCRRCGKNMVGVSIAGGWERSRGKKKPKVYRYYKCFSLMQKGTKVCKGTSVRGGDLEDMVVDSLFKIHVDPAKVDKLIREQKSKSAKEIEPLKKNLDRLEKERSKLSGGEERLMKAYRMGAFSAEKLKDQLSEHKADGEKLEADLETAQQRLAQARMENFDIQGLQTFLESAYDVFQDKRHFEEQRGLLGQLIEKVVVDRQGGEVYLRSLPEWLIGPSRKAFKDLKQRSWEFVIAGQKHARADI